MQRIEQITLPRPIWPDDDLKRSQFYFEVFESLEAVYLDLCNHAWFSAPFLASSLFLEVYHNRAIFRLLRSAAYCAKLYYGYTGYLILRISTLILYGSLLLLSFLLFHEVTTYALQHGRILRTRQ